MAEMSPSKLKSNEAFSASLTVVISTLDRFKFAFLVLFLIISPAGVSKFADSAAIYSNRRNTSLKSTRPSLFRSKESVSARRYLAR